MFVTASDFDIEYNIPNLQNQVNTFASFVDLTEKKYLSKYLLGFKTFDLFLANISAFTAVTPWSSTTTYTINGQASYNKAVWKSLVNGNINNLPSENANWTLVMDYSATIGLRDGADYTYNDNSYRWDGMKEMLKPLVYSEWLERSVQSFTGAGVTQGKTENADFVNPAMKISESWNDFAVKAGICDEKTSPQYSYGMGLYYNYGYFKFGYPYLNMKGFYENTLFGYMTANKAVFTDWEDQWLNLGIKNPFGI
jgi:hypothetical protein